MNEQINETVREYKIEIYKDQFSILTRAVRRNLLIVSSILIILTVEGIEFKSLFGMDLENLLSSKLAIGAMALVVFYELVTFLIYALIDHRMWLSKVDSIIHSYLEKSIENLLTKLSPIGSPIEPSPIFNGPENDLREDLEATYHDQLERFKSVTNEAKNEIMQYNDNLKSLNNRIKRTNYIQFGRIYLIDWFSPILISLVSLYRSEEYVYQFVRSLFN
jgi:hypothetical protein